MPDFEFTPTAEGYVPRNAYWLARCANLAYETPAAIQNQTEAWGLSFRFFGETEDLGFKEAASRFRDGERRTMLEGAGTEGFAAGNDAVVIVCFRGTEEGTDFVADASAIQVADVRGKRGKLHSGFATAFSEPILEGLKTAVRDLARDGQGIWVTGHSLGGALATLAAAELAFAGHKLQGVYTFGQPRVFDPDFAKAYDEKLGDRHFRFVNNNDIVTDVPPERVKIGKHFWSYRHVGQRIYIKTSGELTDDIDTLGLTIDRAAGYLQAALERDFADGVSDHKMVNYLTALEQNYAVDPTAAPAEGSPVPKEPPPPKPREVARAMESDLERLLEKVEFDPNKAELTKPGQEALDEAARLISGAPQDARFLIEGHTDNQASAAYNLKLSRRRAEAVRDYLVARGLDAGRFETAAFGEGRPVASNETEKGRRLNRRVEIRLETRAP